MTGSAKELCTIFRQKSLIEEEDEQTYDVYAAFFSDLVDIELMALVR